nr:MAG TPA: hypothetical protein [Caudoviricetes sp.]
MAGVTGSPVLLRVSFRQFVPYASFMFIGLIGLLDGGRHRLPRLTSHLAIQLSRFNNQVVRWCLVFGHDVFINDVGDRASDCLADSEQSVDAWKMAVNLGVQNCLLGYTALKRDLAQCLAACSAKLAQLLSVHVFTSSIYPIG